VLGDDAVFAIDLVGHLHVAAAFCFIGGKIVARGRLDSPSGLHEQRRFACAIGYLAFRAGVPPEQKSCGRTALGKTACLR
jgi:hypothetical protein